MLDVCVHVWWCFFILWHWGGTYGKRYSTIGGNVRNVGVCFVFMDVKITDCCRIHRVFEMSQISYKGFCYEY